MGLWGRLVSAFQAGYLAFNQHALVPSDKFAWGDRDARLFRYAFLEGYFNNVPYNAALASYSVAQKSRLGLYKYIRPINNPTARLVELYVGEVYGGSINYRNLADGAIPVETENDALRQSLIQLYRNSNWQANKSLFTRFGAMLGDVAVKVVDNRQEQQVYLEVLHPGKIHTIERDSAGQVVFARIEYQKGDIDPVTGNYQSTYTYTEEIDPNEFRTFKDGTPFAFFNDDLGVATDKWHNDYGFVPLEVIQHRDMGLGWGASVFHQATGKIDEINDAWSILNDNVRKAVNIIWFHKGRKSDITISMSERDNIPIIYGGPEASDPFAMVPDIDITAAGQNILNMQAELERDMPELAMHQLRSQGNMTAPGIRAGWSDAIDRIVEARGNYDAGMVNLNKMGTLIGSQLRYPGFEDGPYTDLNDERLEHQITERAVIEDQLSEGEKLQVLSTLPPDKPELARLIMETIAIPDESIEKVIGEMTSAGEQAQPGDGEQPLAGEGADGNAPAVDDPEMTAEVQQILSEIGLEAAA